MISAPVAAVAGVLGLKNQDAYTDERYWVKARGFTLAQGPVSVHDGRPYGFKDLGDWPIVNRHLTTIIEDDPEMNPPPDPERVHQLCETMKAESRKWLEDWINARLDGSR